MGANRTGWTPEDQHVLMLQIKDFKTIIFPEPQQRALSYIKIANGALVGSNVGLFNDRIRSQTKINIIININTY